METFYSVISILEKLKEKYRQYLKSTITDVLIIQTEDEEELFLNPNDSIEVNAKKIINDLSPYSIINTIDLFDREACEQISKKYNVFGIDK